MLKNRLYEIRTNEFLATKRRFCQYIKVSEQQYSRYEGSRANPSLDVAMRVASNLRRTVEDIWYFDEEVLENNGE